MHELRRYAARNIKNEAKTAEPEVSSPVRLSIEEKNTVFRLERW